MQLIHLVVHKTKATLQGNYAPDKKNNSSIFDVNIFNCVNHSNPLIRNASQSTS